MRIRSIIIISFLIIPLSCFSQSWKSVGSGANYDIGILITDSINHVLYAGGDFDSIGGILAHKIAKWDGKKWYSLNSPAFNFYIIAIALWRNDIYTGGPQNNRVHKWDGSTWTTLPAMDGGINVLKVFHDTLYAGGNFLTAGKTFTKGIAKWNGTKWLRVGDSTGIGGCDFCGGINDIELYKDTLVIAGIFPFASGDTVNNIAKWDGKKWRPLGKGLENGSQFGDVFDIYVFANQLYAGGKFINAGGNAAKGIAIWNGNSWNNIGDGFNGEIHCINFFDNKLVVGGTFSQSGSTPINGLAEWDGHAWTGFGGNLLMFNSPVSEIFNNEFYAGGGVQNLGGQSLKWIARWSPLEKQTQPTLCNNTCEGTATVTAVGGKPPYTYQWSTSPVQTTPTATGLCAGTYLVSVTDISGSPTTGTVVITSTSDMAITDTATDISCNGNADGKIALSVTGGIIPYTYHWSSSDTISGILSLTAGSYQVTVTDSLGCVVKDSAVVDEPQVLIIEDTVTNATCAVCADGIAAVTVSGGTPPYTYKWSNGGSADSIANRLPGMYVVTVTDRNGCVAADTAAIDFNTGAGQLTNEKWIIAPSPVTDKLQISNDQLLVGDKITVTDLLGQTVLLITYHSSPIPSIDVSHLPPGMYLLSVKTKQGNRVIKFIKQ